ncbi:interphotoreceptor matrix proteoglycan 2-like isoform X3 [Mixophyes fleayi]
MNAYHRAACEQPDPCRALYLQELTSAYKSAPGFDKIEILNVTLAGTVVEYKVLFTVRAGTAMSAAQELVLTNPNLLFGSSATSEKTFISSIHNASLADHADPCADWFSCPLEFQCVPQRELSALCLSPCHSTFCHNNGICIHRKGQQPECQCPIGRDFWYMGQTCDYRMSHHRLAAIACAVVFCIIICAAAAVFFLVRRFQTQILQQKVAQTQSSYRRFSRFDDVPTQFWCPSQTWLTASASLNSLDNPAFSSSEEVFPLQALGSCVCGCQDGARTSAPIIPPQPPAGAPRLETSCSSVNDLMIDSGKASDVSVCSWPMEPIHWTPFPILHQLSLQSPFHARRPHSYFEGMELVNTERSWTA